MALRAAKGDEDAQRSARAHACRVDNPVDASPDPARVFKGAVAWPFRILRILHAALR
jgi:hypothetical protein